MVSTTTDLPIKIIPMPVDKEKIIAELKESTNYLIKKNFSVRNTNWIIIEKYKISLTEKNEKNGWEAVSDTSHITLDLLKTMIQHIRSENLPIFMNKLKKEHIDSYEDIHESLIKFFRTAFFVWTMKDYIDNLSIDNVGLLGDSTNEVYKQIEMKINAGMYEDTYLRGFLEQISITYGVLKSSKPKESEITLPTEQKEEMKEATLETYQKDLEALKDIVKKKDTEIKKLEEEVDKKVSDEKTKIMETALSGQEEFKKLYEENIEKEKQKYEKMLKEEKSNTKMYQCSCLGLGVCCGFLLYLYFRK
jgi:hypothetical protein